MPRAKSTYMIGLERKAVGDGPLRWWAFIARLDGGKIAKTAVIPSGPQYQEALAAAMAQFHTTFFLGEPMKEMRPGAVEDEE